MVMEPEACIAPPEGNGESLERCLVVEGGSMEPARSAIAWPRERMVWMASSARPPNDVATMGMHSTPASRQAGRLEASLALHPHMESMAWGDRGLWEGLLLEGANHVDVESSRATTAPAREEHISGAGEGASLICSSY